MCRAPCRPCRPPPLFAPPPPRRALRSSSSSSPDGCTQHTGFVCTYTHIPPSSRHDHHLRGPLCLLIIIITSGGVLCFVLTDGMEAQKELPVCLSVCLLAACVSGMCARQWGAHYAVLLDTRIGDGPPKPLLPPAFRFCVFGINQSIKSRAACAACCCCVCGANRMPGHASAQGRHRVCVSLVPRPAHAFLPHALVAPTGPAPARPLCPLFFTRA